MIGNLFNEILHRPLVNLLVWFYNTVAFHDLGIAIVLVTVFVRLLLFPLFQKSLRHQQQLRAIQPKMKEIQEKHKSDPTKQTAEIMALYKSEGVNPFSGMVLLVIQLPILIALYRIFLNGLDPVPIADLYSFVAAPVAINATLFGLINLDGQSILMVTAAAAVQYVQGKMALAKQPQGSSSADRIARSMVVVGPLMTILIFFSLPAAVSLYWLATSLFSVLQQALVNKKFSKNTDAVGTVHKTSH